jgi:hypothetical protein
MSADTDDDDMNGKRERSPSFPYLDLETSIDLTRKLYALAKASEIRVTDVAEAWDLSPKSGSLGRYAASLAQFGLVNASGSGDKRRIAISTEGRRIIEDDREGVRERLCHDAALRPKIIAELYLGSDRVKSPWGKDRPGDKVAESALKFDLGFTADAAKRLLSVYDQTVKFVVDEDSEAETPSQDEVGEVDTVEPEVTASVVTPAAKPATPNPTVVAPPELQELNRIIFKSEGDGTVTIMARLNKDGFDELEAKIAAFKALLG